GAVDTTTSVTVVHAGPWYLVIEKALHHGCEFSTLLLRGDTVRRAARVPNPRAALRPHPSAQAQPRPPPLEVRHHWQAARIHPAMHPEYDQSHDRQGLPDRQGHQLEGLLLHPVVHPRARPSHH